jgi:hypothetical protein
MQETTTMVWVSIHEPNNGDRKHVSDQCPMVREYRSEYVQVPARFVRDVPTCGRSGPCARARDEERT